MLRKMLMVATVAGVAVVVAKSWPDLVRYLKIRQM